MSSELVSSILKTLSTPKGMALTAPAILAVGTLLFIAGQSGTPTGSTAVESEPQKVVTDTSVFSQPQKDAIGQIAKDYLIANPEVFLDIQTALEDRMAKVADEKLKEAISSNADAIYRNKSTPVAGNPDGDISVVEFFDYNCGFCKRGFDNIAKLAESDDKVRLVFKELPILTKGSEEAAKVALAARKQGRYWDVHSALLRHRGQANLQSALKIAAKLGLDMSKIEKDMESPEVLGELESAQKLAREMGINGTPHFLVGDRAIAGAPEDLLDQLKKNIAELRKDGCAVC